MSALVEKIKGKKITAKDIFSIGYHDKFDYPLTLSELNRWKLGNYLVINSNQEVEQKGNFVFVKGRRDLIIKRAFREKTSVKKIRIAKKAVRILKLIPSVTFVGITGSLGMLNADIDSDIDFIIVTSKGALWTTRLLSYLLLKLNKIKIRKAGSSLEKDHLCLNMWLDSSSLSWKKRNIFTAHEIAQIMPLYDSNGIYTKFVNTNSWVREYWPNALLKYKEPNTRKTKHQLFNMFYEVFTRMFEPAFYYVQYFYMKGKITKEQIGRNRAIFHPVDWSKFILNQLSS